MKMVTKFFFHSKKKPALETVPDSTLCQCGSIYGFAFPFFHDYVMFVESCNEWTKDLMRHC